MSRNTEYKFVPTDSSAIIAEMISAYENLTGRTLQPADPERLFISWIADVIIQERTLLNHVGNQNIPSRATGENLDALGEEIYMVERHMARYAKSTMRFTISEAQTTAILVPIGTRVTDKSGGLVWTVTNDVYVPIGETSVEVMVQCTVAGTIGNGYTAGQINTLIDVDNVLCFLSCENIDTSFGGSEQSTDDEYYELMRASMDSYSCAGARGGYIYFAKQTSSEIADVVAISPSAGEVALYAITKDGQSVSDELKEEILKACSEDTVRPLTDKVSVEDPESVEYNIKFTYYIPEDSNIASSEIQKAVDSAVNEYTKWQSEKLGRDINPSYLYGLLMKTSIKRITMVEPYFVPMRDGKDNSVPQIAVIGKIDVINGGYENE